MLHEDRLFPIEKGTRSIAREIYAHIKSLPILSSHGHVPAQWFAANMTFSDPSELLVIPDHYIFRLLYSQGILLGDLGIPNSMGQRHCTDKRKIWQIFADNYYLFAGTPTRMWLDYVFHELFGISQKLTTTTAMDIYDEIDHKLQCDSFRPRSLYEAFNIEVLSTTDNATDSLDYHQQIRDSGWQGRIIPCFRPDDVTNLHHVQWRENVRRLGEITDVDIHDYASFIEALQLRRVSFKEMGATATDHGVFSAYTNELSAIEAQCIFNSALQGKTTVEEAHLFTAHMLMEMARMSCEDGLVMQIHPGSFRNHNEELYAEFGADRGADIPVCAEYTNNLSALLNKYGNNRNFSLIVFTLDESTYSRELAPLAGHYPALRIGPAWWFHDSFQGMRRFRQQIWETASIYNTTSFIDDTRAFPSIAARHDVARRIDCGYLAELVQLHIIDMQDALCMAKELAYNLSKKAYRL